MALGQTAPIEPLCGIVRLMEVANELMVRGIVVGVFQENCWVIGNRRTGEALEGSLAP